MSYSPKAQTARERAKNRKLLKDKENPVKPKAHVEVSKADPEQVSLLGRGTMENE